MRTTTTSPQVRGTHGGATMLLAAAVVVGGIAACSGNPTDSEQYKAQAQQLAEVKQQLADVAAERDALAGTRQQVSERHAKALATQEAVRRILDDPEATGTEQEVVDALAAFAVPGARMDDAVFGAVPIRSGWYNSLYGGAMDATIDVTYTWLSEDGSQGGELWLWHGTNLAGRPFELAGVALDDYDENGLITNSYVVYPYADDYVRQAVTGAGT